MKIQNYLRTRRKTVTVKLTTFLNLALHRCNNLALITPPLTPTEKSPLQHVVLDSLGPRISWTCWWRERSNLNQKFNLNCPSYIHFIGLFALRKTTISFVMSVRTHAFSSTWNNLAPTAWIFMKLDIWVFFENLSRKFNFHYNRTRIMATVPEDQHTCFNNILLSSS
jgi:hypothetical protein